MLPTLGPLSWVQVEIGHSLARGLELLAAFRATPTDPSLLRQARNQIHQAVGAIQMVGLEAVVAYTDEIERQLGRRRADGRRRTSSPTCAIIDRACRKLAIFLDELVAGAPPVPLKLFPEYEAMQRLRGVKAAAATDLFFPEMRLAHAAPRRAVAGLPDKARAASPQAAPRSIKTACSASCAATATARRRCARPRPGLERVSVAESARAFWWTVGAFFEAIVAGGLDPGFGAKQLAARLDLQIRRVVEGSVKVADAVAARGALLRRRERAGDAHGRRRCRKRTASRGSIPSAEVLNADMIRLQPILHEVREELGTAKNIWLRVTLGRADSLPKLRETLQRVHENAVAIGNEALTELDGVARRVSRHDAAVGRGAGSVRDGVRDGDTARRERRLELRQPREQFPEAGRGDAARGSTRRANRVRSRPAPAR